tara:strand:+ start:21 stop:278 length:258 start_codon:yes stop_codon:yes gene_type:complete
MVMNSDAGTDFAVDQELDVKGLNCPLPILRTKLALSKMDSGQVLHVMATDPHSVVDFQAFCERTAHEMLRLERGDDLFEFYIRRE